MITEEMLQNIFRPNTLKWRTAITRVEPNKLLTRGYLQENLIGNISFADMTYLLLKDKLPSKRELKMLEAVLVSFCDHGVTPPSTQSARIMASAGSTINACVAGGLLAFGKNHAGAIENAMLLLQNSIQKSLNEKEINEKEIQKKAEMIINDFEKKQQKIPGFGHRYHNADPRVPRLMELALELECSGPHCQLALALDSILSKSKNIRMNIDGANAGILSDLGFDWRLGTGIFMIGRLPGILAHIFEEITRESPFRKFFQSTEIYYDGKEE